MDDLKEIANLLQVKLHSALREFDDNMPPTPWGHSFGSSADAWAEQITCYALRAKGKAQPPGKAIWLCAHNAHQEIASIPKGGYVVPKHLESELVSMLRSGGVVVGKPISIPLILEGDLVSLDDEVEP